MGREFPSVEYKLAAGQSCHTFVKTPDRAGSGGLVGRKGRKCEG